MKRALALLVAIGCSDPDQPTYTTDIDADSTGCGTIPHYGALGSISGNAGTVGTAPTLAIRIEGNADYDVLFIKLVASNGVFAAGLAPGSYDLGGADLDLWNCGLCVQVLTQYGYDQTSDKSYAADSGHVTLTSISPIIGSASDLAFTEVDKLDHKITGGCQTTIKSISFSTK